MFYSSTLFKMSPMRATHSHCSQSLRPLANSCVNSLVLSISRSLSSFRLLMQVSSILYVGFVYTSLHDAPNLVVDRVQVWDVWWSQINSDEVGGFALQQLNNGLTARRAGTLSVSARSCYRSSIN